MRLVVVVKRDGQVLQRGSRVRLGHPRDVVSLHRFDEALGHAVALRTSDRRRDGFQAHFFRERQRVLGNVAGTVVAEPFDFVVGFQRTIETVFYSLKHHSTMARPPRQFRSCLGCRSPTCAFYVPDSRRGSAHASLSTTATIDSNFPGLRINRLPLDTDAQRERVSASRLNDFTNY